MDLLQPQDCNKTSILSCSNVLEPYCSSLVYVHVSYWCTGWVHFSVEVGLSHNDSPHTLSLQLDNHMHTCTHAHTPSLSPHSHFIKCPLIGRRQVCRDSVHQRLNASVPQCTPTHHGHTLSTNSTPPQSSIQLREKARVCNMRHEEITLCHTAVHSERVWVVHLLIGSH